MAGFTTVRLRASTPAKIASAASSGVSTGATPDYFRRVLAASGIVLPIGGLDHPEHDERHAEA